MKRLKALLSRDRGLYLWLLIACAVTALCVLLRPARGIMNALAQYVTTPLKTALAHLCALTSLSVAEVLILSAVALAVFALAGLLRRLIREKHRARLLWRALLWTACLAASLGCAMTLLWGVNYHTDSFQDRSGITARQGTVEELTALAEYFAAGLSVADGQAPRDENGLFTADRHAVVRAAPAIYEAGRAEFPCLRPGALTPKEFVCSHALTAIDFTGFYFPLTGEANLNMDSPVAFLPATAIHELAHQSQIASEQECNFVAIAVSIGSDDPLFRYSGWLMGYIHVSNALYRADPESWQRIRGTLPEGVIADIRNNNDYWASAHTSFTDTTQKLYDSFIRSSGDPNGVRSYGMVVDLLLAYYGA